MPQAIATAALGWAATTGVTITATLGAAIYYGTYYVAQTVILGTLSRALAKKPSFDGIQSGTTATTRSPTANRQIVYGRTRVGGTIVYMESTDSNKYLHLVVALAGHELDALEAVYFNDEEVSFDGSGNVTSGSYANKVRIKYALGTSDQAAFTDLVSESDGLWTSNHRLRGVAALYVRLEYDQDKFPSGVPNITALVRGKKVYDPRSGNTTWSQNPALCLNDYLTNTDYGLGSTYATEIDSTSLIAAANICDENVTLADSSTEKTYLLNGSFNTSATPETVINAMLTSMIGKAVWTSGKWRILAGAYYTPTLTFDEGDLRSGFKVQTKVSRRENFNSVKGTFSSIDDNYQATSFPPVIGDGTTNATMADYVTQDNGERVYKSIELPFTTSPTMAQRIAKIELERARQQITISLPLKLVGLKARVGDVVQLNNTRMGWSAKPFEVVGMSMSYGEVLGVDLELRETASEVFDWTAATDEKTYDPAPNTNLPNPFQVGTISDLTLNATDTVAPDGTVQSGMLISWTPPVNSFVTQYEVQYIRGASNFDWGSVAESAASSTNYGLITNSADSSADYGSIADATAASETEYNSVFVTTPYYVITSAVAGAEYAVRVRAINTFGVRSAFVTSNEITYGDQNAPDAPSTVVATPGYRQITLTWLNPTVADFDFVEVYRNTVEDSATATRIAVLRGSMFVDSPLAINVTRYYWLKAVDRTGNKSGFTSAVSATTEFIDSDSFSAEVLNLFAEAGAYGIEPVSTLPATGDFDGQIKYDTTNNKLWRWDATGAAWTDDIFSITAGSVDEASFASGIEPVKIVSELPNPSGYTGASIVFLTTDSKLYRYNGSAWTTAVPATDISGELAASNFAQSLRPVEVVSALPSSGNFQGRVVLLTTDDKMYRYTGTAWTAAVPTTDLSGTIQAAQIAAVAASTVTGTLTNDQIADLATSKLTGTITETQITDGAISTAKLAAGSVSTAKLAAGAVTADTIASNAITSAKINAGAITTAKIAAGAIDAGTIAADAVTAEKIAAGAVEADAIAANAVTTGKLAAGAVTADQIAANAITTGKIAAGAVTASEIAANTITASQIAANTLTAGTIAAGAIGTDQLAANAVTAAKIAAETITADQIAAGAIQTDKIAANAITGGLIAASGVITIAAQIDDAVITNAKIQNGAITTAKISDAQITGAKIASATIASANIADAAITTAKIGNAQVDTLQIAGNAVTVPVASVGSVSVSVGASWTTIKSLANTDTDIAQIVALAFASYSGSGWGFFDLRLLDPNNNVLVQVVGQGSGTIISQSSVKGTYTLQAKSTTTSTVTFSNAGLVLLGVKK